VTVKIKIPAGLQNFCNPLTFFFRDQTAFIYCSLER